MNEPYKEIKTKLDGMALFYGEYRGNSIGRCLHYLWSICGCNITESCSFVYNNGNPLIKVYGCVLATIDHSGGYPRFTFLGEFEYFNKRQSELLGEAESN